MTSIRTNRWVILLFTLLVLAWLFAVTTTLAPYAKFNYDWCRFFGGGPWECLPRLIGQGVNLNDT